MRKILLPAALGAATLAIFFFGTLWALERVWPRGPIPVGMDNAPAITALAPLPPVTRTSIVVAPVSIALSAIRDAMEKSAPRDLAGQPENPLSKILAKAEIGWNAARGPLAIAGGGNALVVTTLVNGTMRATGKLSDQAAGLTGALAGLVDKDTARNLQNAAGKALDQRVDLRGNVAITARPQLFANWRIEPNLNAQVTLADGGVSIAGVKVNVAKEVKPVIDRAVNEQVALLQGRLRNDPIIEQAARNEWAKMCRTIPLGKAGAGLPDLWLEMRPTKAFALQPRIDANALTLILGVQAETRISPNATRPTCPFPARLELTAPIDQGHVNISVPIDVPFTEIDKLLNLQLGGKTFPDDGSGAVGVTVQSAKLTASGDRLLISLRVKAHEKKSWFGFGAEATVHVWGKPALDQEQQILRLTDITMAVESEAAFGLLGAAAKQAMPYLQRALAQRATIDLKPFAANTRKSIDNAIGDFRKTDNAIRIEASVKDIRLTEIAFDSKTLRVIAEAEGNAKVAISALP